MRFVDISGQRFGRLIVLSRDIEFQKIKNSHDTYWKCKCDCGQIKTIRGQDLKNGKVASCGCLKKERLSQLNKIQLKPGDVYGKLTILKQNGVLHSYVAWLCKCDCGNQITVSGKNLRSGRTQSCGCLKSKGQLKLIQILNELKIPFETQKSFDSCKLINKLKFDFYLPIQNVLIEYQGQQHFQPIDVFGGQERFKHQQQADKIKQTWSFNNDIKLIKIPYYDYSKLDCDYLKEKLEK